MIKKETIDKIFDSADILQVVGDFVPLTIKGVNWTGLCPFHNEKTPSFIVSPSKNMYKCFGCGEGGNSVSFLMKSQNMSYPDALKYLAHKYNITVEEEKEIDPEAASKKELKEQLIAFNYFAAYFYAKQLYSEKNKLALHYVSGRFTEESIKLWSLGFAPASGRALYNEAKLANYKDTFLLNTGLFRQNEKTGEYYDFFRNRIVFPVADKNGTFISFSARSMPGADKRYAKYMNLSDTALYNKKNVLYGLNFALKSIIKTGGAILVEGNPDVVKMHEIEISNTIAPSGTALTIEQLRLIKKYSDRVILLFDGDEAGQNALRKNGKLCIAEGLIPYAAVLPADQDPDTFFTDKKQAEKWIEENKTDYLIWFANSLFEKAGQDPSLKNETVNEISALLFHLNASQRDIYIDQISKANKVKAKLFIDALKDKEFTEPERDEKDEYLPDGVDAQEFYRWGFYEYQNEYHFRTKGGLEKLSNFKMIPVFHIDSVMDPKRIYELTNSNGYRVVVNLDMQEMTSLQAFQRVIEGKGNFMFTGQMGHFQKLKAKLYEETRTCLEVKNLGWQKEGFWAWANGITTPDGEFQGVDEYGVCHFNELDFFIPAFSKIYIKDKSIFLDERKFQYKKSKLDLDTWLPLFLNVHGPNAMIGFAFYLAALFRDHIIYLNDNFPLLNLFGQKGSGKNTLAYSLMALFGKKQTEFNIHNGTKPGLAKHLETFSNAIAFIDEYKNSLDFDKIETLKSIYNAIGRSRMNMDKGGKKETTAVNQAVILAGQEMPTVDIALSSRMIYLTFLSKEGLTKEKKINFEKLQDMERDGLSHFTHHFLKHRKYFVEFFKENYEKVMQKLTTDTKGEEINDRILRNNATVLAAFVTMEQKINFAFDYKALYKHILEVIRTHNNQLKQSDEIGVFWNLLEALFDDNVLIDRWHFKIDHLLRIKTIEGMEMQWPEGKRILRFKFNAMASMYAKHIKQRGDKALPADSLKHYLKTYKHFITVEKSCRFTVTYYDAEAKETRSKSQTTTAFCFDYDKLGINMERLDEKTEAINQMNGNAINKLNPQLAMQEVKDDMPF
ncbi:MAG: DNA primase [Bacteroidales bacterium]|nr:DNA primase [Bacteroidales bacterium]